MSVHPRIDDTIVLQDNGGHTCQSRVIDAGPDALVLHRPPDAGELDTEAALELSWIDRQGLGLVDVWLVDEHHDGPAPVWVVELAGDVQRIQRRTRVRVEARGPMSLRPAAPPGPDVAAELIDISEASLRCAVRGAEAAAPFVEGTRVAARFTIGESETHRTGWISALRPAGADQPDEPPDLIVMFEQTEDEADALRQQIFAFELMARRSAGAKR